MIFWMPKILIVNSFILLICTYDVTIVYVFQLQYLDKTKWSGKQLDSRRTNLSDINN